MRKSKDIDIEGGKTVHLKELNLKQINALKEASTSNYASFFGQIARTLDLNSEDLLELTFSDIANLLDAFCEVNTSFMEILEKADMKELSKKFMDDLKKNMLIDLQNIGK